MFGEACFGYCHMIDALCLAMNETMAWSDDFIEYFINDGYLKLYFKW